MRPFHSWATCLLFLTVGLQAPQFSSTVQAAEQGDCVDHLVQERRFDRQLGLLNAFYASPEVANERLLNDVIVIREVRTHFFRLQALLRIYQEIYGAPLSDLFVRVKEAEDLLGIYGDRIDFYDAALKLYREGYLEHLGVLQHMKILREKEKIQLAIFLKSVPGLLYDVKAALGKIDWRHPVKDRRDVAGFLISELDGYVDLPFDMDLLEAGIHAMRRKFRWLLLYIQSLEGLVALNDQAGELNMYRYLLTHPMANGTFTKLNPSLPVENPIVVPKHYFLALSKIVAELGDIKSVGEIHEALIDAYVASGAARSTQEAQKIVEKILHGHPRYSMNIHREAGQVKAELKATGLIRAIRSEMMKSAGNIN